MSANKLLTLGGQGHIYDMGYNHDGDVYILLNVKNEFNNKKYDGLWLKCWVDALKFPELKYVDRHLAKKKLMTLRFDAQYLGFQQSYAGISENDPSFIVHLEAKLLKIHKVSVGSATPSSVA
jgi:hypothetical protein